MQGKIDERIHSRSQIRKMIISAVLARAAAVSGGREVLMSKVAERCFFLDQSFVLEYVPNVHETTVYEYVRFDMKYEGFGKRYGFLYSIGYAALCIWIL